MKFCVSPHQGVYEILLKRRILNQNRGKMINIKSLNVGD